MWKVTGDHGDQQLLVLVTKFFPTSMVCKGLSTWTCIKMEVIALHCLVASNSFFFCFFADESSNDIRFSALFCSWQKTWEARLFGRCGIAYPLCTQVGRPVFWCGTMLGTMYHVSQVTSVSWGWKTIKDGTLIKRDDEIVVEIPGSILPAQKTSGCYRGL